jgi:hypothetical protein
MPMAKGVFQVFINEIRKSWRLRLPMICDVDETFCAAMPKSSTFYAGSENKLDKHLFINFQHSQKPWAVGEFTVNVIFSSIRGMPNTWILRKNEEVQQGAEGFCRLGTLVHGKDKWWRLKSITNISARPNLRWCPTSYEDEGQVIIEAVESVTSDICLLFETIGIHTESVIVTATDIHH